MLRQLLGQSSALSAIREQISQLLARTAAAPRRLPPVLIQGETGTGKGLVASAIHAAGPRAAAAFVDVNCAAIPETLLEAELFGFERGAFTDARQAKAGLLQVAHRGTIFLDEIGLMPDAIQAKLLKVLEDRTVRRLGSTRSEPADAWVISATSEDLASAIGDRRFREDLYHRLAVVTLQLPPLRERGHDILFLARHFLDRACGEYALPPKALARDAEEALLEYAWPGNVRELANLMERVALLSDDAEIPAAALRLPRNTPRTPPAARTAERIDDQMATLERGRIEEALRAEGGNISRAAARLGLPRNTLRYRMARHGLAETPERKIAPPSRPDAPAAPGGPTQPVRWTQSRVTLLLVRLARQDGSALEPEPVGALDHAAAKISGFGGRILDISPSSVRAVFGLDTVEDAPRRAAHAALAVQRAIALLPHQGDAPDAGIALHTGEMLVGRLGDRAELDLDGRRAVDEALDSMLSGTSGNLVLASRATRPFLDREFDLDSLDGSADGPWRVRGFSERAGAAGPFVSRERELALLDELLTRVEEDHGQATLIVGDPGIGKSRLLDEFQRRTRGRAAWLQGSAVSFGGALPLHPVVDLLTRAFSVQPADSDDVIDRRIRTAAASLGADLEASVPALRALLASHSQDTPHVPVDPKLRRAAIFEAVGHFLHASSLARPAVVVLEDLHWMDQATGEFLPLLVESLAASRVLLCVTHRTGYTLPFTSPAFATSLTLPSMARADSAALACAVLGVTTLSRDLQRLIDERTDGNPFFVEEVLRSLDDRGFIERRGTEAGLKSSMARISVPGRVQDVLVGRIERLDAASRDALRVAAAIGREFPRRVLERVLPGETPLDERLRSLRSAELIHTARVWPEPVYAFKHALTQEVAYEAQTPAERRVLHARIGEAIEELSGDRLAEQSGILAHHFVQAERWDKALTCLLAAAQQAERTFAAREALTLYAQALRAAANQAGGVADPGTLMAIHAAMARLYFVTSDFDRSVAEAERILPLARLTNDRVKEAEALAAIGWASLWGRRYDAAIRASNDALALAEPAGALAVQGRALYTIGFARAVIGGLEESRGALDSALQISSAANDPVHRSLALSASGLLRNWTGDYDEAARLQAEGRIIAEERGLLLPLLFSCFLHGLTLTGKGDYDEALAAFDKGLALAERVGDEAIHHRLLNCLGWLYADLGDLGEAELLNAQSARIGRRRGDPGTQPNAELNLAEIFHARGELARAQDQYDEVYRYWKNPPSQWMRFRYSIRMFAGMGALALSRGDMAAAGSHAAESLAMATRTGSRKSMVKALRLAGDIAAAEGRRDKAEDSFRQARDLAAALGNPVQQWKSELALGRFLQDGERTDDAAQAFRRALDVMQGVQGRLRDDRLRRAFAKNPDLLALQSLAVPM